MSELICSVRNSTANKLNLTSTVSTWLQYLLQRPPAEVLQGGNRSVL